MKKLILPCIVFLLFFGAPGNAQSTFDDKRHAKGTFSKSAQALKFNYPKIKTGSRAQHTRKGRGDFQMPSIFDPSAATALYDHKVFAKSSEGSPLFIKSEAKEKTAKSAGDNLWKLGNSLRTKGFSVNTHFKLEPSIINHIICKIIY